jgi:hypothetical protein
VRAAWLLITSMLRLFRSTKNVRLIKNHQLALPMIKCPAIRDQTSAADVRLSM